MKHIKQRFLLSGLLTFSTSSIALARGSGNLSDFTLGEKLTELANFIVSDIAVPVLALGIIGFGVLVASGKGGDLAGSGAKLIAGAALIAAASYLAYWAIN